VTDQRQLRIGDAERDEVVSLLQHAVGDGRLTMSEAQERISRALEAKTYGDLDPLVGDLTPQLPFLAQDVSALPSVNRPLDRVQVPGESNPPGWSPEDPLVLSAMFDDDRRVGQWSVPPYVRVSTGLGDVTLVCLEAESTSRLIKLTVEGGMGDVRLILPEGWAVRADRLTKGAGSIAVKVPDRPALGAPLIEVSGYLTLGSFVARRPNFIDRWLLNRRRRKRGLPAITA